jgi:hypothetical protein
VAVWTRRVAAYKPKREVEENKIKIKNKGRPLKTGVVEVCVQRMEPFGGFSLTLFGGKR